MTYAQQNKAPLDTDCLRNCGTVMLTEEEKYLRLLIGFMHTEEEALFVGKLDSAE